MTPRTNMRDLFEHTMPPDELILARMATVCARRASRRRRLRSIGWSAGGAFAVCALLLVWLLDPERIGAPDSLQVEAERFPWETQAQSGSAPLRLVASSGTAEATSRVPAPADSAEETAASRPDSRPTANDPRPRSFVAPASSSAGALGVDSADGPPASPAEPSWRAVAQAMHAGDDAKAHRLLQELSTSDDAETRDNARLIQVRSELAAARAHPPNVAQLAELDELATSGATSSIRASARRLLQSVRQEQNERD